jgi:hypothetical protein
MSLLDIQLSPKSAPARPVFLHCDHGAAELTEVVEIAIWIVPARRYAMSW